MEAAGISAVGNGAPAKGLRAKLVRGPLFWAAMAAFVGAGVGLLGTFSLAAWLGDPYGGTPPPSLTWSAAPIGKLLTVLSLPGVFALVGGRSWPVARIARVCGAVLVLLFLVAFSMVMAVELGWIRPGGEAATGGPPLLFSVSFFAYLGLPCVVVIPFALAALLAREVRIGAILIGLGVFGVPFLLLWQALSDGMVGEIPEHATAIVLLGGIGAGVSLPAAPLWALLGVAFLRGARSRALGEAYRVREKENLRTACRLYEEGLGKGDFSVLDDLVSDEFRDPRRGSRGRPGMERVFSSLWKSYPDLSVEIEGQEAEGDLVRTRLLLSGTDEGGVLWYPPTGRRATFAAGFADRFSGGRLVEHAGEADTEGLLRQLGLSEEPGVPHRDAGA